jgi:regulatory protein
VSDDGVLDETERCYLAAQRILEYRFNSEAELRRKLRAKKFDAPAIDATIAKLRAEKWLDDERFAGAFTRTRARRNIGARRIRRELHAAGVGNEVASRAVAENVDPAEELERLHAAAAKRSRMLARKHGDAFLGTAEGRNKMTVWLLNQGYDAALIQEALKEILVAHRQSDS